MEQNIFMTVLNWISRKIGIGVFFGVFFILVGIGMAASPPAPGKEKDNPIGLFVIGGALIVVSLFLRFRRRHQPATNREPMSFEDVLKAPMKWTMTKIGACGFFGILCLIAGIVGLANAKTGRNPLIDDEKTMQKPVEESDIAAAWMTSGIATAAGIILLVIQGVRNVRRRSEPVRDGAPAPAGKHDAPPPLPLNDLDLELR